VHGSDAAAAYCRRFAILITLCLALRFPEASAQIVSNQKSLTVTSPNAILTFAGADLVGFTNTLTNEVYLKKPSTGELASINTITGTGQSLQSSNWTIGTAGGVSFASITVNDSVRTLTLTVKIDAATGEVVIKSTASVTNAGLRNASWSIAGLDLTTGRLIVPAQSGVVFDAMHPPLGYYLEYPNNWHAQMAVYEAGTGSFILYSTDTQMAFKQLQSSTRGDATLDLGIATEAVAPFSTATTVPAVEWRLKAFSGDWRKAAQVYRDWLAANRPPVSNSAHPWVQNIRAVVGIRNIDQNLLAPLAAKVVPSQTLLYLHDWRAYPFDINYPDYSARSSVPSFITAAHALGFKVMLHLNMNGVSVANPDYAGVQAFQTRSAETLDLYWLGAATDPNRYAIIDPASPAYRSLFVSRVGTAVNALHPDVLHLDISGPLANDGNGPINGISFAQGAAQLHQDLIDAFPSVALAGEGENDILYRYESFAQSWWQPDIHAFGHPITDFLFTPQVMFYGHLGQPGAAEPTFKNFFSELERRAILPQLPLVLTSDLDISNPDNARLIGIVQSWQTHGFQPDWTGDWAGALIRYLGSNNTTAALTDSGTLEALNGAGVTLSQLGHDINQLSTASFIPNWPAFDSTTLYGLDPAQKYWLDAAQRPATTHVTSLPSGDRLGAGTLVTSRFALLEVNPPVPSGFDFFANVFYSTSGVRYQGNDGPLANGAVVIPSGGTVGGISRQAIFIHPPYQGQIGGETYLQYALPVPPASRFAFSVGIQDGAACNLDGVTFRVTVNGSELFKQTYSVGAWHDGTVDLSSYANSTIALRIISHPGPQNNPGCDWSLWSQLKLVSASSLTTISVPLSLANGFSNSGFAGDGSLVLNSAQTATVSSLPVPGRFVLLGQEGTAVTNGTNLASVPFEVSSSGPGQLPKPGSIFPAGQAGFGRAAGGVTKNPVVLAPPPYGRTILSWVVRLPQAPLRLGWSASIQDEALPSLDGVDFLVLINGVTYWQLTKLQNNWSSGSIDLQAWRGQNVLIQLVTDSRADSTWDGAMWADLAFSPSPGNCSYSFPSYVSVAAQGAPSLSLNITASPTCPWSAVSHASWITVVSGSFGIANGTMSYAVDPNSSMPRSGVITIAGQVLRIDQSDSAGHTVNRMKGQITSH